MKQEFGERPLVGRRAMLDAVMSSILRPGGYGAVVVADAGMGKSALASVVAAKVNGRFPVHRIHTSSSLAHVPFGSLAPLISDLAPGDADSPFAVMRSLLQRLFPDGKEPGPLEAPLLIVDDADCLDEAGADLLVQLVAASRIRLLLLARRIADIPAAASNLVWEGSLSRHELFPLTEDQVHELCVQVLGGPVLTSTSSDLARVSGGNPMLVLALLAETVRVDSLVFRHGVWLLHEQMHPPEGRLGDLLRAQLWGLTEEERDALEIIALAEPLPAAAAFELGLHRAVDSLTEAKLVTISAEPARLLRTLHPLYGDVVRQLVPAARSARLRRRLLTVSAPIRESADNLLRLVTWSLDCGADVPDSTLVAAAYRANNHFDSAAALRLAAAVKGPKQTMAARVQAARAWLQDGNLEMAHELVSGVTDAAADLTTLKMAVLIRVELTRRNRSGRGSLSAVSADWLAGVDRIEAAARENPGEELISDIASSRRGGRLLALVGMVSGGRFGPAEEELHSLLEDARQAGDDEATLIAGTLLAEIMVETGRARSAYRISLEALQILDAGGQRFLSYYQFVLQRHLAALLWLGEWEEVQAIAQRGIAGIFGGIVHVAGAVEFSLAVMHLRKNDNAAGLTHLLAAVEGLRTSDSEGLFELALALAALIAAMEGQMPAAEELLADGAALPSRGPATYRVLANGYRAAARSLILMEREPSKALREFADHAEESGFMAVELELRYLAVSLGDFDGLNRLLKISEEFEGPQSPILNRFARAVLDEDVDELLSCGATGEPEWERLARQCAGEALRLAKASGDRALLQRVQRTLGKQDSGLPAGRNSTAGLPVLTRRERDVAALVMQGYRNAEIAERLFLSVRTVEGHIYRTFEKLGISKREELKQELLGTGQPGKTQ